MCCSIILTKVWNNEIKFKTSISLQILFKWICAHIQTIKSVWAADSRNTIRNSIYGSQYFYRRVFMTGHDSKTIQVNILLLWTVWVQVRVTCLTFTLVLVGPVLTVDLPVAAEAQVDALPAVALELGLRADRAVLLVAAVITFWVTVASPRLRDTVHLTWCAGELLWGAGRRLWGGQEQNHWSVLQLCKSW